MQSVQGYCSDRFQSVRVEFEKNFAERGEVGAALTLFHEGKLAVDLWGGTVAADSQQAWSRDTLVEVFSSTKGMTATCMHVLIDRGLVDVDAPVARYWPEFAANGKADVTVAMVLAHQAGLPFWEEEIPKDGLLDWNLATSRLAQQAPLWEPGTRHGYHGMTHGFLVGEIMRRVTGKSVGRFLRDEVAQPLGADVWIGLPESEEPRVVPVILAPFDANSAMFAKVLNEPDWIGARMLTNCGELFGPERINSRQFRAAESPATGGVCSAHGLARMYAPLAGDGSIDGVRIVSPRALPGMRRIRSASSCDIQLQIATTFTLGFSNSWGSRQRGEGNYVVLGERAFGTPGMGGSMGFADGEAQLAFGYVMNRLGVGVGLNERSQSLIDATYRAVGYSSSDTGQWVR